MLKAIDVANYIVSYVAEEHPTAKLTHVKLQKIIYYAYATLLKNQNFHLFDEKIEKWQYVPVVRSVYDQFKTFGYSHIDRPMTDISMKINDEGAVEFTYDEYDKTLINSQQEIAKTISEVVDKLIGFDAFELVDLTHEDLDEYDDYDDGYDGVVD